MRTIYDSNLKASLTLDDNDEIRAINHVGEYPESEQRTGRDAAATYVSHIAEKLNIAPEELRALNERVSYLDPQPQQIEYRLSEEKALFDTITYAYYQTYLNTPVWEAGITATLKQAPLRVIGMTNTSARGIEARMPSDEAIKRYLAFFATGEKMDGRKRLEPRDPHDLAAGSDFLLRILGDAAKADAEFNSQSAPPRLIRGRFFIYRFDPTRRSVDPPIQRNSPDDPKPSSIPSATAQPLCGTPPTLPLPPVSDAIREGGWYLVAELIFRLPYQGKPMNWRMLVEIETDSILYLRALSSGVAGNVFVYDPITSTGTATNTASQGNATLNPLRTSVTLPNLNGPVGGSQSLDGSLVTLTEIEPLTVAAPTRPTGSDFNTYNARTNDFAAVNAYYHNDRFFQLVEDLGFPRATYFDGTAFPVEVDHRGAGSASDMGNLVNAHCIGDGDGIAHACYALADLGDTGNPIGIAADWRVILHELGGHGILYDHVNGANFGFSHSAGDSFAMIMNDYLSSWHTGAAIDRFVLAPFITFFERRSDKGVADAGVIGISVTSSGAGYTSAPTVTFTGGAGTGAAAIAFINATGHVNFILVTYHGTGYTSAPTVTITGGGGAGATATATIGTWGWGGTADLGGYLSEQILSTTMFRFYRSIGGDSGSVANREFAARCSAYLLLRAVGTLTPMSNPGTPALFLAALRTADSGDWTSEGVFGGAYEKVLNWAFEKQNLNGGVPPAVDVYIDDGRAGEYQFLPVHYATTAIWNRRMDEGSTPGLGHEEPALGVTNYAYVKIKNRGTSIANNVVVKGYHCKPSAGVTWPGDFDPFTTPQIAAGTLQPNNTEEKIVGPFQWTPVENVWGHDCMLMVVSATDDPANTDKFTAGEAIEDWRLVPNDNNVAQRNVTLAAGGGGGGGLISSLQDKGFWIGNPGRAAAKVDVSVKLPALLERRGWRISLRGLPQGGIRLKSRERQLVTFEVNAGEEFTAEDVKSESDRDIVMMTTADGVVIGGMVYRIDPDIKRPYNETRYRPRPTGLRECLKKINWLMFLVGAFVAALIGFLTDGWLHESLVIVDWRAVYAGLGIPEPQHSTAGLLYFAIFEIGRGLLALFVYVFLRCCCKPGVKTAMVAAVLMWLAFSLTGPAQFIPLGFFSNVLWIKVAAFQLVTSLIATITGAAIYKERAAVHG